MPSLPPLPPIADAPISIILLARDCAATVEAVVLGWQESLVGLKREHELILVADGSRDGTAERAGELIQRVPGLSVLSLEKPQGEGAALRAALAVARHPLVLYSPCDPAYRPEYLGRLLDRHLPDRPQEKEIDHVHVMPGYRAGRPVPAFWRVLGTLWRASCCLILGVSGSPLPGWLGLRAHLGRLVARVVFGLRSRDVACPFRLARRHIFARIPIQSNGPFAHVEILAKANFLGMVIAEELPLDVPARQDPNWLAIWREGYRVFQHADFGPTVLPQEEALTGSLLPQESPTLPPSADQP